MDEHSAEPGTTNCAECGAAMAHDQRYCLACGARRSPLPRHIQNVIGRITGSGRQATPPGAPEASEADPKLAAAGAAGAAAGAVGAAASAADAAGGGADPAADAPAAEDGDPADDPETNDSWLIAPRAAAAAVMGMLGFGVIVGALVGGSAASVLSPLLVALRPPVQSIPVSTTAPGSGGGGSSSGGATPTTRTITIGGGTTTVGGGGGAGGGGGGGGAGGGSTTTGTTTTGGSSGPLPPIKHVFLVMLSNESYQETFGHVSADPYLATTLVKQGLLIPGYYAVAGSPLANGVAMVSGQGPTPQTQTTCAKYSKIKPGTQKAHQQIMGKGCVYPKKTETLGDELTAKHLTWNAYIQVDPKSSQAAKLETCSPKPGSTLKGNHIYSASLNPFLWFESTGGKKGCPQNDVPLTQLSKDIKSSKTAPSLSYIVPDLCDDGSPNPCTKHAPAGMKAADKFLKEVVPEIEESAAYKDGGMILITSDEAPQTGAFADSTACCGTPTYPNLPPPPAGTTTTGTTTTGTTTTGTTTTGTTTTGTTTTGTTTTATTTTGTTTTGTTSTGTTTTPALPPCVPEFGTTCPTGGGGQIGLLVISKYVLAGTQDPLDQFDHFGLLGSIEDLFGLKRLGYAASSTLTVFSAGSIYKNYFPAY